MELREQCGPGQMKPPVYHTAAGTLIFASDDVLEDIQSSRPCRAHPRQDLVGLGGRQGGWAWGGEGGSGREAYKGGRA